MSRHPDADGLMAQRYVDGLLSGAELAAAEQRLERDASFRQLVERLGSVGAWFADSDPLAQAPAGFANRIAFAARTDRGGEDRCRRLTDRLVWAAGLLMLLGFLAIAGTRLARSDNTLSAEGDLETRFQELLRDARRNEPSRRLVLSDQRRPAAAPRKGSAKRDK